MKVTNISTSGNHYLIHVFYKDLSSKDIHAYSKEQLDQKVTEICADPNMYDFYIYKGIDFELIGNLER